MGNSRWSISKVNGDMATIPSWALFHEGISAQEPVTRFVPNRVLFPSWALFHTKGVSAQTCRDTVCPPRTDAPPKECVTVSAAESEDRPPSELGGKTRSLRFTQALPVQDEAEEKAEDHSPPDFVQGLGISNSTAAVCPFGGCPPKNPNNNID